MTDLTPHAIRLAPRAERDIAAASAGLASLAGPSAAAAWEHGFFEAVRTLGTLPGRCPLAPENDVVPAETVRQLIYQRRSGGVAHRILFSIRGTGPEGPTVFILHVRHAAQSPATAREMQSEDS